MSNQGYVKLYRQIQDSVIWDDPYKLKLWLYCLLKAAHCKQTVVLGEQIIELEAGQFVTGRISLETDFNKGIPPKKYISGYSLFRWLKVFENVQMLHIKKTNKYTIITVLNWDKYQNDAQQMHNSCTTNAQQMHTNNNSKNSKNIYRGQKSKFISPSLEEVTDYCRERNNNVDPQVFMDYYESNGWKVGKNPMKDWKAAVRNWERKETSKNPNSNKEVKLSIYEQLKRASN